MKLLLIIYKIEDHIGSEDGTGYSITHEIVKRISHTTIITRNNNIDKLRNDPHFKHVTFINVDVPKFLSFYKKKNRGVILYYYLWQICVGIKIFKLQRNLKFDIIHQLNFHALWAPHFIFSKSKIVLGPLTQHPNVPYEFWYESRKAYIFELIRTIIKGYFVFLDPFLKWGLRRTNHILIGQHNIIGSYRNHSHKIQFLPQAGSIFPIIIHKENQPIFNILYVGRFISLKGCMIAIESIHECLKSLDRQYYAAISVTFIGHGPLALNLNQYAEKLKEEYKIEIHIIDWINQPSLLEYYKKASLFLFPSLEAQGLVVAEAMANGCPVLCIENTGPEIVAGEGAISIPFTNKNEIVVNLGHKIQELIYCYFNQQEKYQTYIDSSLTRAKELSWENKASTIVGLYNE